MCQAQSSLPRSQDPCPSSGAEEKQLNLRAVATETLDGKPGAQGFDTRRGWLFLGIQVLYVPLDPRQVGVSTELLPFLGDEDHPCLGADAAIGQLVANHSVSRNFLGNKGHAARRGDGRRVCREDVAHASYQEKKAGDDGGGACHVLEIRGLSSEVKAGNDPVTVQTPSREVVFPLTYSDPEVQEKGKDLFRRVWRRRLRISPHLALQNGEFARTFKMLTSPR